MCANNPVVKHSFGTIAKGQGHQSIGTRGHLRGLVVQAFVTVLGTYQVADPPVENTSAVDAEQDADTRLPPAPSKGGGQGVRKFSFSACWCGVVVYVGKGVDPGLGVVAKVVADAINNTGRARGSGYLAGV